jgi:hypothetical protein
MVRRQMIDRLAFEQTMSEPRWATTAVAS